MLISTYCLSVSSEQHLPFAITIEVRDTCLCLHLQRAARAVARRFDAALRPLSLTNGQFSLLMSLNREEAPSIGSVSALLAMDRTTLTANLKPLERRGLIKVTIDDGDKRSRQLKLTPAGRALLVAAVPIWKQTHAVVEKLLPRANFGKLRVDLVYTTCWACNVAILCAQSQGVLDRFDQRRCEAPRHVGWVIEVVGARSLM